MKNNKIFFTSRHQLRTVNNFTGDPFSMNRNLGLKGGSQNGYYYSAFANADGGPMVIIRERDKVGPAYPGGTTIIGSVWPDKIKVMNQDGTDVQSYDFVTTKYNGQDVFIPIVDLTRQLNGGWKVSSSTAFPWIPSVNNPNRVGGITLTPDAESGYITKPGKPGSSNDTASQKWSPLKIFGVTVAVAAGAGALFMIVKKIIKPKGGK